MRTQSATEHRGTKNGRTTPKGQSLVNTTTSELDEHLAACMDGGKLFRRDWIPVIQALSEYWRMAFKAAGQPKTISGEINWNSTPLQWHFKQIFQERHPVFADYFLDDKRKTVRRAVRDIGLHLSEVLEWYDALPEEQQEHLNAPRLVWDRWKAAHQPNPNKGKPSNTQAQIAELTRKLQESEAKAEEFKGTIEEIIAPVPPDDDKPARAKLRALTSLQVAIDNYHGFPGGERFVPRLEKVKKETEALD